MSLAKRLHDAAGAAGLVPLLLVAGLLPATSTARAQFVVPGTHDTIQAAIDDAEDGFDILVLPGTYHERIDFLGKAIIVHSEAGPDETVIDATGLAGSTVACRLGEGPDTLLDGFTVTGGEGGSGGGMHVSNASPTVVNCIFRNNISGWGGGAFCDGDATFIDCRFVDNWAETGGGLALWAGTARRCTFRQNASELGGGGIWLRSGGLVVECLIEENTTRYWGGDGIWVGELGLDGTAHDGGCSSAGPPRVINCRLVRNGGDPEGGAIGVFMSELEVTGCLVLENDGGGIGLCNITGPHAVIANCTVTGNTGTGVALCEGAVLQNSIVWGNSVEVWSDEPSTVSYSDVRGGWPGEGNIDADPRFLDPATGDCRLMLASPCIDSGNSNGVPPDTGDVDEDGDLVEPLPLDLGRLKRLFDELDVPDTGHGGPPVVDMGAYESQWCSADVDSSGTVGMEDLLAVLSTWGDYDPCPPFLPEDADQDCRVGFSDILAVLTQWGPCAF